MGHAILGLYRGVSSFHGGIPNIDPGLLITAGHRTISGIAIESRYAPRSQRPLTSCWR